MFKVFRIRVNRNPSRRRRLWHYSTASEHCAVLWLGPLHLFGAVRRREVSL